MGRYLTADELMAQASEETGLDDFGPGDFREGLEVLLDSLEEDGDVDPAVDERVMGDFRRRLANRLEVEQWYAQHPEVDGVTVRGPIDINGLPRTGTTALAHMMSLDPQFRGLRSWEQYKPCPPPTLRGEAEDPRRVQAINDERQLPGELKSMHLYNVDATMEDTELLGMAFHGQQMTLPVYTYQAWWRSADLTETYRYHRRVVKLLGSQRPPDLWLFKAPHHKFHLEALVSAYPDIRFLMTHRDPVKVVPSYCSIVSTILPPAEGQRDLHRLGQEISEHLRVGMENAIAARSRIGDDRFLDVHQRELTADYKATIRRIYDWLGVELTPSVEKALADWHAANKAGAHGTHHYTAEQYGLSASQIRSEYDFYTRHFDVALEG